MPRVPLSRFKVEIAWGQSTGGLFTFGGSLFGGPDRFAASSWSRTFTGTYDDVSADVLDVVIDRGRDSDLVAMRAGTTTITLKDPVGLYNRKNPSSPLAGFLTSDKPVRVTAYDALGVAHGRFYGFTSTVEADVSERGTATITAIDFLDKLDRQSPVLSPITSPTTGGVLGSILDWFSWTDPAMRSLSVGDSFPLTYTRADGSRSGLGLVAELLASERGIVFIDCNGAVKYVDRRSRYLLSSTGALDRLVTGFPVAMDGRQIVNQWTVTRTDMAGVAVGLPQFAEDFASRQLHGPIADSVSTPFLANDTIALALAQGMVLRTKDGLLPVYDVPIDVVDNASQTLCMSSDLGDRVTLTVAPPNFAQFTSDFYIESISERISGRNSPRYSVSWRVSEVPALNPFRFGPSLMGGPDVLYF